MAGGPSIGGDPNGPSSEVDFVVTTIDLGFTLPATGVDVREGVALAKDAESWGYRSCWAAEVDGPDAITSLAGVAATTDLDLGTAVLPVQTRTPFVLAMTAIGMSQLSGGRFQLGLGASSSVLVERFGGVEYRKPLKQVRECVEALRPILDGERGTYDGEFVKIGGYKHPTPFAAPIPILIGALNPGSLRMTGELADGVCLNQVRADFVPTMLDVVREGAAAAGRTLPESFPVVSRLFCLVTDDADGAKSFIPHVFAPYVATGGYNRFYSWQGYAAQAAAIAAASEARDKAGMAAAFDRGMVDDIFLIGTADEVVAGIREHCDHGVTQPVIAPLAPGLEAQSHTLKAIADAW